jgi:hypothetical protein
MLNDKKPKLYWCGVLVIVIGALSFFGTIYNAIIGFQNYQNYLTAYSHGIPSTVNTNVYLNNVYVNAIVFGVIYALLTGIGVYIVKMGIKPSETQTSATAQTESALIK